jgi:hypothetical protein
MFGDDPPVLADYDAVGIGMNLVKLADRKGSMAFCVSTVSIVSEGATGTTNV